MLALLYPELPAMVEEAAERAARQLYGDQARSALRFLVAEKHAQASAALTETAQEIESDGPAWVLPEPLLHRAPLGR